MEKASFLSQGVSIKQTDTGIYYAGRGTQPPRAQKKHFLVRSLPPQDPPLLLLGDRPEAPWQFQVTGGSCYYIPPTNTGPSRTIIGGSTAGDRDRGRDRGHGLLEATKRYKSNKRASRTARVPTRNSQQVLGRYFCHTTTRGGAYSTSPHRTASQCNAMQRKRNYHSFGYRNDIAFESIPIKQKMKSIQFRRSNNRK